MADVMVSERLLQDGTIVLELRGELSVHISDVLRSTLIAIAKNRGSRAMIVGMRHVTFVGPAGMNALLAGYHAARIAGVRYVLQGAAPLVEKQLRATGLHHLLAPPQL
jgi:stage II sporulation protein AA (anti-sigma F factor antagonist)